MEPLIWLGSHRALQASVKLDIAHGLHAGSDVLKDLSIVTIARWNKFDFILLISCLELFYNIYLLAANQFKISLGGQ